MAQLRCCFTPSLAGNLAQNMTPSQKTVGIAAFAVVIYAASAAVWPGMAPLSAGLNLPLFKWHGGVLDAWQVSLAVSLAAAVVAALALAVAPLTAARAVFLLAGLGQIVLALSIGSLEVAIASCAVLGLWSRLGWQETEDDQDEHEDEKDTASFADGLALRFGMTGRERRKGSRSHKMMIDMLDDGLISIDRLGVITSANQAAEKLIGTACEGTKITRFLTALREPEFADLTAVDRHRLETTIQRESSATLAVEFSLTGRGEDDDWVGVIRLSDNSDRAAQMAKLEKLALHDALTGLPNRVLFYDRINQAISIARRRGQPMAVMLMDLNKFKQVNDTLGHHVGDLLLQAVGPRLSAPLRNTDTLARLGGDEFAVLLPAPAPRAKAMEVAERLVEELDKPFVIDGMTLDIGVSIGIAMFPEHGDDCETMLHNADMAMYTAKRGGLGVTIFSGDDAHEISRRVKLQQELRLAIDNGDLDVVYQPKVDAGNWEVTGFEALVRWQHPEFGELAPSEFIPLAEHTGLIMPLTLAVINACLSAQKAWRQNGFDLSVAVNLSPKWLQDREFPKILRLLLENWHGRADRLILEIPESAIMTNPNETTVILRELRDQGLELSLDDFCTGHSSLPLLQRLPVQELKIDKRFIAEMMKDQNAAVVVSAVIKLAHSLDMRVVAEGVESQSTAEWLKSLGGDELQGYYFGRPMSLAEVPEWISSSARKEKPQSQTIFASENA